MGKPFDSRAWYTPDRDGDLKKYLEIYDGLAAFPLFRGFEQYVMLKDKGLFLPDYSVIRLMWNVGRGDEHFLVLEDYRLEGLQTPAHAGREGIHEPEKIFTADCPCWEAHHLKHF